MAEDGYVNILVLVQHISNLSDAVIGGCRQIRRVGSEENTAIEGHLNALEAVSILNLLNLSILNSLSLSLK